LDFVDGGLPSTYLATVEDLLGLHQLLLTHAASLDATWVVIEIADGLLQRRQQRCFDASVHQNRKHWLFAAGDSLAADSGVRVLRGWGIEPIAISGVISMSPLAMREAHAATGVQCLTAKEIQCGDLNPSLQRDLYRAADGHGLNGHSLKKEGFNLEVAV